MTEQQPYTMVQSHDAFEVRRYPEHLLAEVITTGAFEEAGNHAFRDLFAYISGENRAKRKISMTAPVVQDDASQKIAMTAPVLQQGTGEPGSDGENSSFRVAFVLPKDFTLENAPEPTNPKVQLRVVPASLAAVIGFGGRWSSASYQKHLQELRIALRSAGLDSVGPPRFARFDPPFKPWFMRHNEILLDLRDPAESSP